MSDPVARLLQSSGHDPVADILQSAQHDPVADILAQDIPQGITANASSPAPTDPGIDQLLARQDISPQQRARLVRMKQQFRSQVAGPTETDNPLNAGVRSFLQGTAEPFAAVSATGARILGKPGIASGIEGAVAAMEPAPTQSTTQQVLQTAAYTVGNFLSQKKIFDAAGVVATRLGLAAKAVAPVTSQRALSAIAQAATKVGEAVGPTAGEAVAATPRNLVSGLLGQAAQDPSSLTTPQGAATAVAFSLFGALTEGRAKALQAAALVKEVRTPEAAEVLKQHIQQEAIDVPYGQLPTQLQAAHVNMRAAQDQALATIEERLAQIRQSEPEPTIIKGQAKPDEIQSAANKAERKNENSDLLQATYLAAVDDWRQKAPWLPDEEVTKIAAAETGLQVPPKITIEVKPAFEQRSTPQLELTGNNAEVRQFFKNQQLTEQSRVDLVKLPIWVRENIYTKYLSSVNRSDLKSIPVVDLIQQAKEAEIAKGTFPLSKSTPITYPTDAKGVRLVDVVPNEAAKLWADGSDIPGSPILPDPEGVRRVEQPKRIAFGPKPGAEGNTPATNIVARYTDANATDKPKIGADPVISTQASDNATTPVKAMLAQVEDPNKGTANLFQKARNAPAFLYKHLVKSTAELGRVTRALQGKDVPFAKNIEALADMSKGSSSTVDHIFHHGGLTYDPVAGTFQANENVPSLQKILEPLITKDLFDEFRAYLIANRKINDEAFAAKAKSVDEHMARLVVDNASPVVRQQAEAWYAFNKSIRQMAEDAGLVGEGMGKVWDAITDAYTYLPRAFEKPDTPSNLNRGKSYGSSKDLFLTLKGGNKKYVDPVFASIDKAEKIIKAIYRNQAVKALADGQAEHPQEAARLGITQLADADAKNTPEFHEAMNNFIDNMKAEGVEVTKAEAAQAALLLSGKSVGGVNHVAYWENGEVKRLNVPGDIVEAFNSLNPRDTNLFVQFLGLPAKGLRSGITLNPVFQLYNFVRDSYDATLNSRYGFKFGLSSFEGFISAVRKDANYRDWLANGGGFGSVTSSGVRNPDIAYKLLKPQSKGERFIRHPIEVWKDMISPVESAARVGEFIAAKRVGAASNEAAWASRTVTVDFSQIGLSTQAWSYMTAFMNPAIQGLDTTVKAIAANPRGVGLKGFMAITLPSMYLWYANRNDKEIQQLRKSQAGLTSWFMRLPSDEIVKIPKPFFYGQIFGTAMEAALDKLNDQDPRAMDRLAGALGQQVGFSIIPNAITIPGQLWANKDVYSGAPMVPADAQDLTPEYQYGLQTTELAKKAGQVLGYSPAKIDFIVRQLLGHAGQELMMAGNAPLNKRNAPTPVSADYPLLGRLFARYPSMGVEPVQTFYSEATKTAAVIKTVQALEKDRPQEVEGFLTAHREDFLIGSVYAETRKQITELKNAVELITRAPAESIRPDEKRKQIDYLLRQIITITTHVNDAVDSIREKGLPQ